MTISTVNTEKSFLNHISLDCVIFGFHEGELRVLSLFYESLKLYALPGGFIGVNESLEEAAYIVLKERTGLDAIFLKQFHVFSDFERSKQNPLVEKITKSNATINSDFFDQRFITVGFYALVEYTKVNPTPDFISDSCKWVSLNEKIDFILDHSKIINKALQSLREQLNSQPIGYNLLPDKFTMSELRVLYETILGKELDRRNFQRKIMSYNILNKLNERRKGGAHKSPFLFEFNLENYKKALNDGLQGGW